MDYGNTEIPSMYLYPRRRNVATQVAKELKTVTYTAPPMEERRKTDIRQAVLGPSRSERLHTELGVKTRPVKVPRSPVPRCRYRGRRNYYPPPLTPCGNTRISIKDRMGQNQLFRKRLRAELQRTVSAFHSHSTLFSPKLFRS